VGKDWKGSGKGLLKGKKGNFKLIRKKLKRNYLLGGAFGIKKV